MNVRHMSPSLLLLMMMNEAELWLNEVDKSIKTFWKDIFEKYDETRKDFFFMTNIQNIQVKESWTQIDRV